MRLLYDTLDTETYTDSVRTAEPLAGWGARVGSLALDVMPLVAVLATMALLAWATPVFGWQWWIFVAVASAATASTVVNRTVLPARTGWTLGRAVRGIRVVRADQAGGVGQRPGTGRLLVRDVAHLLDTPAMLIGWLWPLWDRRNRTFADLLAATEVRVVEPPTLDVRRIAAWVLIGTTLVCAAGAGLGYAAGYRHDRAVLDARAEISEQGPRMVERLLSYGVDTVVEDFAQAQALTTDSYRPQLIAQQQAVQKAALTSNQYSAVSSAVLSVQPDRAAMLAALQGQRGSNPNDLKFITATVRVDFEKVGGSWKVAALTVLKRPQSAQPPAQPAPSPSPPPPGPGR